jgi:hypothetical protein
MKKSAIPKTQFKTQDMENTKTQKTNKKKNKHVLQKTLYNKLSIKYTIIKHKNTNTKH